MKELFKLNRIKESEMLDDISNFLRETYRQSYQQFTPASPYGQILLVLARIGQMMFYYIEDSITELFLDTASRPDNIRQLATLAGHNPARAVSAQGTLFLAYNGVVPAMIGTSVSIPNFVRLKCADNGLDYVGVLGQDRMKVDLFGNRTKIYLKIIQGKVESQQFTATGLDVQSYAAITAGGSFVEQYFLNVFVNGEKWRKYDSLQDIPRLAKGYITKTGISGGIDIFFGNENFGAVPTEGATIIVEYLLSNGESGNIRETAGVGFEFIDIGSDITGADIDLNKIFNIGISAQIGFGSNPETTNLTRLLAPGTSRSYVLANTSNYSHFFEKMQIFSYINVFTKYVPNDPWYDNVVYSLLLPDIKKRIRTGESYFTIPVDYFQLTDTEKAKLQNVIEESGQKVLGTTVHFLDPIFKRYAINIQITAWSGYNKDTIRENIISKMSEYFLNFKRKDLMPKSDLIAIIESVEGVDSVSVYFVSKLVEAELALLLNPDTVTNSSGILRPSEGELLIANYTKAAVSADKPVTELTNNEKLKILLELDSVKTFINKHLDSNGDIIINKGEIPLIRGGWKDRFSKTYFDLVDKEKNCAINVNFIKETEKDIYSDINKSNVNNLRK